ncbi:hypothetical protein VIBNISOn1_1610062 [Vibrio nigripulchritudo SOn1]|uniref:Uncharacterized protein n=1 Tax=Vibrio nigripulchritudo SOn1 TaxID=1238450 RepID=A0AAV2VMM1_9VIBR|nr:hypothetical protein VIBNISOn1_1610062 [Vibrio nigripulchritudo SOn1]
MITEHAYPPVAEIDLMSAWMPAPPLLSEPAIVSTIGGEGLNMVTPLQKRSFEINDKLGSTDPNIKRFLENKKTII